MEVKRNQLQASSNLECAHSAAIQGGAKTSSYGVLWKGAPTPCLLCDLGEEGCSL